MQYSYTRYLVAKKTVDDRALNRHVVDFVRQSLVLRKRPLRVFEVGGGLGTMLARLVEWNIVKEATCVLLDADSESLAASETWLREWATQAGFVVGVDGNAMLISGPETGIALRFEPVLAEIGQFFSERPNLPKADVVIANAFLDLVDVPSTLPSLLDVLTSDGIYWFSTNFDGDTIFEPGDVDDDELLSAYHRSMDVRHARGRGAGDSKTGRHLFGHLRAAGASVAVAGGSDWVVHAQGGRYGADEAYFLHHIVHTVEDELRTWPEVDPERLARWGSLRHEQITRGELVYIAHQIDFAGRRFPDVR